MSSIQPIRFSQMRFGKEPLAARARQRALQSVLTTIEFFYTQPRLVQRLERQVLPEKIRISQFIPDKQLARLMPTTPVIFPSADGLMLNGVWVESKTPSNKTVILGHGYMGQWREMVQLAHILRESGYNALMFDFRAHGNSEGLYSSIGWHEAKDLAGAVAFVKTRHPKASEKLVYVGHSMGTAPIQYAPSSLKDYPEALKLLTESLDGYVLDAPYADLTKMLRQFIGNLDEIKLGSENPFSRAAKKLSASIQNAAIDRFEASTRKKLGIEPSLSKLQPPEHLKTHPLAQKPVLVLHGDADRIISPDHGEWIYHTLKERNDKAEFVSVPGADHLGKDWDPFNEGEQFMTSIRGGQAMLDPLLDFLKRVCR